MLRLFNSLTRTIEDFKPINSRKVGMYTCGPTVYSFATIGNFRTYFMADILHRVLKYDGYGVKYVMNVTDVGHLTGDNLGDADLGEDRMEKAALREHKTAYEVADFYTQHFLEDYKKLNLLPPDYLAKATDHIKEQIDLISRLEDKGYTYLTSDGVYFDTSRFPKYGELSDLDQVKEGARVEVNLEKRNARDFALWKFSYPNGASYEEYIKVAGQSSMDLNKIAMERRQMEWESPWGKGFPGWHIECSAMSMKYLGESFDIHTGGIDLKSTHHPNEIAQSEAATNKKFVNYWLHGAFILIQGQKMSKSLNNVYRLYDLEKAQSDNRSQAGFDPLALRFLYLQTHYRQEMNFTFPALEAAQNGLNHLRKDVLALTSVKQLEHRLDQDLKLINLDYEKKFKDALNDDLNTSEALSVVWELLKSDEKDEIKLNTILNFDQVLGLNLDNWLVENKTEVNFVVPREVLELVEVRKQLRKERRFAQSDQVRNRIKALGFDIEDGDNGIEIKKLLEFDN